MKKLFCVFLALLLLCAPLPIHGTESPPVEIRTVEDLLAISDAPDGNYILMNDLDLSGIQWKSLDFSGTFDGNGHAILNLSPSLPGDATPDSYDGNAIAYQTAYVGLFGTLSGAAVYNLQLLNVRTVVEMDCPVFLAGIAGYMEDSTISGCTVTGCLELRAHDRMFGVGGIAGYGWGAIENCTVDMTLITVDTDTTTRDEQFLGGIYGTGFIDVTGCSVTLDGYVSEYGYVHSGGVVGMYMAYPYGVNKNGRITDTSVTGKITFFEKNSNRRAYCKALIGEALLKYADLQGCVTDFTRDERFEYTQELRPEVCPDPVYTGTIVPPGCGSYGYTLYSCTGCGYSYTDHYTLFSHTVTGWTETLAPTPDAEGLRTGTCDGCGLEFTESIPKLEPLPTETEPAPLPTESATQSPQPTEPPAAPEAPAPFPWVPVLIGLVLAPALIFLFLTASREKAGKFGKKSKHVR